MPSSSRFRVDIEAKWTPSAKIKALLSDLNAINQNKRVKSVVFSQWTAFFDLVEVSIVSAVSVCKFTCVFILARNGKQEIYRISWDCLVYTQIAFRRDDLKYTRLDGTMSQPRREDALKSFASWDSDAPDIILISMKAGGVGINLTCATNWYELDL